MTKLFERVGVLSERVTKPFKRMQIFFEWFTNGCKRNPAQKRKVVKVHFPVHGHICIMINQNNQDKTQTIFVHFLYSTCKYAPLNSVQITLMFD